MQQRISILVTSLPVFLAVMAVAYGAAWAVQSAGDAAAARLLVGVGLLATVGLTVNIILLVGLLGLQAARDDEQE